jgi:hypothetical protein
LRRKKVEDEKSEIKKAENGACRGGEGIVRIL